MRTSALLSLLVVSFGCSHSSPSERSDPTTATTASAVAEPTSGLVFEVEPASAELIIDGQSHGPVPSAALSLPPGVYQVSLKAAGYVTWRAEVSVTARIERVKVRLPQQP